MKNPKLKFQDVYFVDGWATEIVKGKGVHFPKYKESFATYDDVWLVWLEGDDVPTRIYGNKIFTDLAKANYRIEEERKNYKEYLEKEVKEKQEKLKNIFG